MKQINYHNEQMNFSLDFLVAFSSHYHRTQEEQAPAGRNILISTDRLTFFRHLINVPNEQEVLIVSSFSFSRVLLNDQMLIDVFCRYKKTHAVILCDEFRLKRICTFHIGNILHKFREKTLTYLRISCIIIENYIEKHNIYLISSMIKSELILIIS